MKRKTTIPSRIPSLISRYLDQDAGLSSLYQYAPTLEGLKQAAVERSFDPGQRAELVEILRKQCAESKFASTETTKSLDLLAKEGTVTVTTGHQLCLFGGPMFFPYKILSTIVLVQKLRKSGIQAVPVYWMASEDHDFEEINHFVVGENRYAWKREPGGPVGRMKLTGLENIHEQLQRDLGNDPLVKETLATLKSIYQEGKLLSLATRELVDWMFGKYGVITLDADEHRLKKRFVPAMLAETRQQLCAEAMNVSQSIFSELGVETQVNPREVNLFYMRDEYRERIVSSGDQWSTADAEYQWTPDAFEEELKQCPEHFSPNVVMRPLYQESILPNVAYVGGPGELSYWLQLKPVFDRFEVRFPMVQLRDMALILNAKVQKRIGQLSLEEKELYGPFEDVFKRLVREKGSHEHLVADRAEVFSEALDKMITDLEKVDPTLAESAKAERARIVKRLAVLEKKVLRSDKKRSETIERQLREVLAQSIPNNTPQERVYSLLMFTHAEDMTGFFDKLLEGFNPFERGLKIFEE